MIQRDQLEVYQLHSRPKHPICPQPSPISRPQLLSRITPLHDRECREEKQHAHRRKHKLVRRYPGQNLDVGPTRDSDEALEKTVPMDNHGAENDYSQVVSRYKPFLEYQ